MSVVAARFPLVLSYRGTLEDTAALVGLRNMKVPIHKIVYMGGRDFLARRYLNVLNKWLAAENLPTISTTDKDAPAFPQVSLDSLLASWDWKKAECSAAIRLAGLPLPSEISSDHSA